MMSPSNIYHTRILHWCYPLTGRHVTIADTVEILYAPSVINTNRVSFLNIDGMVNRALMSSEVITLRQFHVSVIA